MTAKINGPRRAKLRAQRAVAKLPDPVRSRLRGLVRGAPSSTAEEASSFGSATPSSELLTDADVTAAYRLFHGRAPDPAGLAFFSEHVAKWSVREVLPYFAHSEEFRNSDTYRILVGGVGDGDVQVVDRGDHKVVVPEGDDAIGAILIRTGTYEPHISEVLAETLTKGATFVDGGANIGILSLQAAALVGETGTVVSIEALAHNAGLINVSAAINGFGQLQVIHAALGESGGSVVVSTAGGSNGILAGSMAALVGDTDPSVLAASEIASSVRLDDIAGRLERVDVIKLDVEGAEGLAIAGALRTIERHRPIIVLEYSPALLQQVSDTAGSSLLATMLDLNYTIQILGPQERVDIGSNPSLPDEVLERDKTDHLDLLLTPT